MHREAAQFIARARHTLEAVGVDTRGWSVVEVGSRDVNGRAQTAWGECGSWLNTDIADGPNVDVVGDGAALLNQFVADGRFFDLAVSAEVFEHAPNWSAILQAMTEVAKYTLVTCASTGRAPHSAIDGRLPRSDEHYANVSVLDVGALLGELRVIPVLLEYNARVGDLYLLCS